MQYGFVIDHTRCIGCHACTTACKSENDVPVGAFRTWVKYTEVGTFPSVRRHFGVLRCNHCTSAPCVTICPVTALDKRPDGIVDLDRDVCIGCKACMQACPYDALYINEDKGCAEKCHFCAHRIEQNLEPACVVVCPEQAILFGDLHDPTSKVSQMRDQAGTLARRVEQKTGPNVHYVGAHAAVLTPGKSKEAPMYLWSERRELAAEWPEERDDLTPNTLTALDVHHPVVWGWKVNLYLVTKGIAGGAATLSPFVTALGLTGFSAAYLPEILGLVFLNLTTLLLVADLKRPQKFLSLLLRPNTRSWLVKGAWVLMGFGALQAAALAARFCGASLLADLLRWPAAGLGAATAGYTAFLFAQCEGRDLWQNWKLLLPHLLVQALFLGALALLPFAPQSHGLAWTVLLTAFLHLVCALLELKGKHPTDNARQAAMLLPRVPLWPGSKLMAFSEGILLTSAVGVLAVGLGLFVAPLSLPVAAVLALGGGVGIYFYEQAYVRAGQLPPLS